MITGNSLLSLREAVFLSYCFCAQQSLYLFQERTESLTSSISDATVAAQVNVADAVKNAGDIVDQLPLHKLVEAVSRNSVSKKPSPFIFPTPRVQIGVARDDAFGVMFAE